MTRIRVQRIGEEMKREISEIVRTEIKDPRIGFATITRVEVAGDLQHARVYVSVLGDDAAKQGTMDALTRATGFIRGEISRRLRLRVAPEMAFKLDDSGEYSARIETVLKTIRETHPPSPSPSPKDVDKA